MKYFCAFILATALATGASASVATVTLSLPHGTILPGVPFDLFVTFTNTSHSSVAVGRDATMIVTPSGGDPVRMPVPAHIEIDNYPSNRRNVTLEPGQSLAGYIRWSANYFYNDADLTVPGAYDISLEIAGTPADVDDGVAFSGIVRTPPAHLVRITPVGEDALVWKRLRQVANGKWPSHGFGSRAAKENVAAEVIARHSDSGYFPYAVVLNPSDPPLSVVRDALSRFPDSPAYPHALITAALVADTAGGYAANKAAAADAERYMQLAVSFCDEAAMTKNIAVTDQARAVREHATFIVSRLHDASRQLPKK